VVASIRRTHVLGWAYYVGNRELEEVMGLIVPLSYHCGLTCRQVGESDAVEGRGHGPTSAVVNIGILFKHVVSLPEEWGFVVFKEPDP